MIGCQLDNYYRHQKQYFDKLAIHGGTKLRNQPFGPKWIFGQEEKDQLLEVIDEVIEFDFDNMISNIVFKKIKIPFGHTNTSKRPPSPLKKNPLETKNIKI